MPLSIRRQSLPPRPFMRYAMRGVLISALTVATACSIDSTTSPVASGFLGGTSNDHEIGLVMNSTGKSLTLFQLGNPAMTQQIALGTSSAVTPVGFSVRGRRIAIPMGDAASVAFIDLDTTTVRRYFLFPQGNATGSVFVNDTTVIAANLLGNYVGRFTLGQVSDTIHDTVTVAPKPTAIVMAGSRVLVISINADINYVPIGNGVVTAVDPTTMHVLGSVQTGGTNPSAAALGPDGLLYVVNTGDYSTPGNLTIIDPATLQVQTTIPNMGVGPGDISIDANGLAYISGFFLGTIVWNTQTHQFVRDASNPVCAPATGVSPRCTGVAAAVTDAAGDLYQVYSGSGSFVPQVFVYHAGTFALTDSVATGPGSGPSAMAIRTF